MHKKLLHLTISVILLHFVRSEIAENNVKEKWATKRTNLENELFEQGESTPPLGHFRSSLILNKLQNRPCSYHQPCMPYDKCPEIRDLFGDILLAKDDDVKKTSLMKEFKSRRCGNPDLMPFEKKVCCDRWRLPEECEKKEKSDDTESKESQDTKGSCSLPDTIDIYGHGGIGKSFVDCHETSLDRYEEPPHSVWTLKGGHPMVCCPKFEGRPLPSLYQELRTCTEDEIYDYYEDPDSVDCEPPLDDSPKFVYVYNNENNCPAGTECTNGGKCGTKDFNNTTPPESCGFDLSTGEDKLCCSDIDSNNDKVAEPQPPLFKTKEEKAYPCMDHTPQCEKWAKDYPEHCSPNYGSGTFSLNRYPFMREVCQKSCDKMTGDFRSNKCKNGCVDEYKMCPLWSRLGFCHSKPQFMYFNCRESCGSCGFKSPNNMEEQEFDGKQVTDLSDDDFMCGQNKKKVPLDKEIKKIIEEGQVQASEDFVQCTNVIISDRYALTAAACIEQLDPKLHNRVVKIRDGTKDEELIGVRRTWVHPYQSKIEKRGIQHPVYYDLAIMELERRIIYNYTEYGDSPICIGEDSDIPSQTAVTQGFGLTPNETRGELLELKLRVLSSDECYEKFSNSDIPTSLKHKIEGNLYEGITQQVLCTMTTCDGEDLENFEDFDKCDVGQGDAGAPLFTIDEENSNAEEQKGQTLIAIHSGGDGKISGSCFKKEDCHFYPKWWTKVTTYSDWVKCTKKYAEKGLTSENVETVCHKKGFVFGCPPKCEHDALFFQGKPPCGCKPLILEILDDLPELPKMVDSDESIVSDLFNQ